LHIGIAGWMLGEGHSGAKNRMFGLLQAIANRFDGAEEITYLHTKGEAVDMLPPGIHSLGIDIPATPTWKRVLAERRYLRECLRSRSINLLELGTLPIPPRLPCATTLTLHDLRDLEGWRRRPIALVRMVLAHSLRRVSLVSVPSEFTAERLRDAIGDRLPPVQVVPGAADVSFHHLQPKAATSRPYFLHVGHLEPRKNLMFLLSAYAALLSENGTPESCPALYLVGRDKGEAMALRERAAMLDLSAHVHFIDQVDQAELERLYTEASGLLFPSLHEGFGIPAIEALAVGIPVLVSDRGALPEVIGEAGQALDAEDSQAWMRAMKQAAENPRNPEQIAKRKARAAEYSWFRSGMQMLDGWRQAAADFRP